MRQNSTTLLNYSSGVPPRDKSMYVVLSPFRTVTTMTIDAKNIHIHFCNIQEHLFLVRSVTIYLVLLELLMGVSTPLLLLCFTTTKKHKTDSYGIPGMQRESRRDVRRNIDLIRPDSELLKANRSIAQQLSRTRHP